MKRSARHRNMSGIFFYSHQKELLSQQRIRRRKPYEEYLSCIFPDYHAIRLRWQKLRHSQSEREIKGLEIHLYIYGADEMYDRMDTLPVENGKFSKTLSPDTLVAAWLLFSDGSRYPFFMDKGDKIHIKGSAAELNSMEITGNPHNEELTAFRKELKGLGKPSEKVLEEKAGKFINEHHSSLASIYLLDKYFAQKEKPDYTLIKQLTEHMTGELKDRPYIDGLLDRIQEEEKAATGKTAAYFRLPNAEGEADNPFELQRPIPAKDFWASWDTVSRDSNAVLPQNLQERTKK